MPIADAKGYSQTAYVTIPDGHYKAELDDKFATEAGVKAKSKVFWVKCGRTTNPAVPTTPAPKPSTTTPAVPTTEAPKPSTTTPAVPTTEAPAQPTTSTMGPKVQTDYTGKSSNSSVTLGLALGATALVAGGVVVARRRNG